MDQTTGWLLISPAVCFQQRLAYSPENLQGEDGESVDSHYVLWEGPIQLPPLAIDWRIHYGLRAAVEVNIGVEPLTICSSERGRFHRQLQSVKRAPHG